MIFLFSACLDLVLSTLNVIFGHFVGLYLILGIDIALFFVCSFGVICVIRLLSNSHISITSFINLSRDRSLRSSSGWRSSGDSNDSYSRR